MSNINAGNGTFEGDTFFDDGLRLRNLIPKGNTANLIVPVAVSSSPKHVYKGRCTNTCRYMILNYFHLH